jgi:hypothetical protein
MMLPPRSAHADTTHRERFGSVARELVPVALVVAANKTNE